MKNSTEDIFKLENDEHYGHALITRVHTRKSMLYKKYLFSDNDMEYEVSDFKINPINGMAYLPNDKWGEAIYTVDVDKLPDPHDAWTVKHKPAPLGAFFVHPKDNI